MYLLLIALLEWLLSDHNHIVISQPEVLSPQALLAHCHAIVHI